MSARYQIFNLSRRFSSFSVRAYHQRHNRLLRNDFPVQFPAPTPQTFFPISVLRLHILSDTDQHVESTGLDTQANFLITPRNVLTAGLTVYQDQSSDDRTTISQLNLVGDVSLGDFGPQANVLPTLIPLGPESLAHPVRVPDSSLRDIAFFAQDEWEVSQWVRLYGSLRWDRYTARSELTEGYAVESLISGADPEIPPATLPNLDGESVSRNAWTGDVGLVVRPVQQVALVGHYARSYRHPNPEELFFSGPTSVVEPCPLRQSPTWKGLKSNLENPATTIIKTNKKNPTWLVNTSRKESLFLVNPACMAGVLSVLPNFKALCGRRKL